MLLMSHGVAQAIGRDEKMGVVEVFRIQGCEIS